ncbi:GD23951 [Drosophila simulans]|uniref:GD23951 n=1 Tax=Drosophila simulans TaxID=7240 RepID=B4Q5H1_DROSI|nr:GD23951 [Drosophila simulans]
MECDYHGSLGWIMKSAYLSSKNRRKILQLDFWARQGRGCGADAYPAATSWRKYWHYQQPSFMDTNRWQNGEKNVSRKAEQVLSASCVLRSLCSRVRDPKRFESHWKDKQG